MFFTTLWVKIKGLAISILFVLMVKHINVLNIAFPLKNYSGHIQSIRLVKDCIVISFLVEGKNVLQFRQFKNDEKAVFEGSFL